MAKLVRYLDDPQRGCWSRVDLDSRDPIWISVTVKGVLVKRSRLGLFGQTLFDETGIRSLEVVRRLAQGRADGSTPEEMTSPALKAFTQIALDCQSVEELSRSLDEALAD